MASRPRSASAAAVVARIEAPRRRRIDARTSEDPQAGGDERREKTSHLSLQERERDGTQLASWS
jgi:hypothetical protein